MTKQEAPIESIRKGNAAMREAYVRGKELRQELGMKSAYGAMRDRTNGDESQSEKMRKYRTMADQITEKELENICKLTLKHGKAWGPTHLVALSRLDKAIDRRMLARRALREGWGHSELQREVQHITGEKKDRRIVGRKRKIDLMSEASILDQISGLCVSWVRLFDQLHPDDRSASSTSGIDLLPPELRNQFLKATRLAANLQELADERLKQSRE